MFNLRLAARYTSKEGADDEEPELDLATVPSIDNIDIENILSENLNLTQLLVGKNNVYPPPNHMLELPGIHI